MGGSRPHLRGRLIGARARSSRSRPTQIQLRLRTGQNPQNSHLKTPSLALFSGTEQIEAYIITNKYPFSRKTPDLYSLQDETFRRALLGSVSGQKHVCVCFRIYAKMCDRTGTLWYRFNRWTITKQEMP